MNGETLLERIVKAAVSITLFAFFLIGAIVLITGCADVYLEKEYVPPHIVSINPPVQEFTFEESKTLQLYPDYPFAFVNATRDAYNIIRVTFSSRPRGLNVNLGLYDGVDDYHLKGNTLYINVFCPKQYPGGNYKPEHIYIEWEGGQMLQLWCPFKWED